MKKNLIAGVVLVLISVLMISFVSAGFLDKFGITGKPILHGVGVTVSGGPGIVWGETSFDVITKVADGTQVVNAMVIGTIDSGVGNVNPASFSVQWSNAIDLPLDGVPGVFAVINPVTFSYTYTVGVPYWEAPINLVPTYSMLRVGDVLPTTGSGTTLVIPVNHLSAIDITPPIALSYALAPGGSGVDGQQLQNHGDDGWNAGADNGVDIVITAADLPGLGTAAGDVLLASTFKAGQVGDSGAGNALVNLLDMNVKSVYLFRSSGLDSNANYEVQANIPAVKLLGPYSNSWSVKPGIVHTP